MDAAQSSGTNLSFRVAYSIKTNPTIALVRTAFQAGLLAEAISQREVRLANSVGFLPTSIIMNGPAKFSPDGNVRSVNTFKASFCDSIEELRRTCALSLHLQIVGLRLRPPMVNSRFGIPLDDPIAYKELIDTLGMLASDQNIGVHFHFASSALGTGKWWALLESVLEWAHQLEQTTRRQITCLDVGGGWFPNDWTHLLLPNLGLLADKAKGILPNLTEIILEPGKALVQPFSAMVVRVLEIRTIPSGRKDIVVDGAISDLPEAWSYPHRIVARDRSGNW